MFTPKSRQIKIASAGYSRDAVNSSCRSKISLDTASRKGLNLV